LIVFALKSAFGISACERRRHMPDGFGVTSCFMASGTRINWVKMRFGLS
jgi:hypothetical protein